MKATYYTNIGKRPNQEDNFGINTSLYAVCDGVGGHAKGEVASKFITDYVLNANTIHNEQDIVELLENAQKQLNETYGGKPESTGMGTTFCGIFTSKQGSYIAHIGDSRVYWCRPLEEKVWHTWDHSLVGELMKSGEISREEGRLHPMSNRISRAIIANAEGKTAKADIVSIDSIKKGDVFLLCSDGVTESWPEKKLVALLLQKGLSIDEKRSIIEKHCSENSKDNNTAILLEAEETDEFTNPGTETVSWLTIADFEEYTTKNTAPFVPPLPVAPVEAVSKNKGTVTVSKKTLGLVVGAFLVLIALLFISFYNKPAKPEPGVPQPNATVNPPNNEYKPKPVVVSTANAPTAASEKNTTQQPVNKHSTEEATITAKQDNVTKKTLEDKNKQKKQELVKNDSVKTATNETPVIPANTGTETQTTPQTEPPTN